MNQLRIPFVVALFSSSALLFGATLAPAPPLPDAVAQILPIAYQIQLQVRADTGGTAFNLPNGSTFNSVSPYLNNAGNVAVKVNTVGLTTSPGLWFGGHGTGSLVYNANDNNALVSDPYLNQSNQASFPRFASTDVADDGLYVYDHASGQTTRVTSGPLGATSYTNPKINDNGLIGMRVKFNVPQALGTYNLATTAFTNYVTETSGNPNSPYSFIYAPAFNNNNRLAAQVNLGAQASTYKELRIWNPDGSSILAAAGDSTTGPVFFAMDNSISMNNLDRVAFTTRTSTAASTRRIVVADGTTTTMFPTVSDGAGFTGIDFFAPVINDSGLVAFRGNDNQATPRDSVFITNGTTVQRIAGVNDTLMTDTGPRVVAFLMGGVSINNLGEVAFGVQFSGGGNAIYVAYLATPPSPTPTPTPTATPSPSPTATPSPSPTATPTPSPTPPLPTPTPTATPVPPTPTPTPGPSPTATPTPAPVGNGKIAFASVYALAGNTYELSVMDANGSNFIRLTDNAATDFQPAWSPDGTKIAFASDRDSSLDIYVIDENGANPVRLTNDPAADSLPAWSPDGAKLTFTSIRDGNYEVYVMGANGSNQINLTNSPTEDSGAAWSPDGSKIAFTSFRDGNYEIYVMGANGSNPMRLTNNPATEFGPAWSPDGTRITFVSDRDGNPEVYVMDANGSNAIRLTNDPEIDTVPRWSPDGSKIVFSSRRDGNYEIYVMDANGANPTRLTNAPPVDFGPDWQRVFGQATPTPTPAPTATPTPTPSPAAQPLNLSTRMRVQTGDNVGIGGFIISGSGSKNVLVRAIGPSLTQFGVPNALPDPVLELHGPGGFVTLTNNNWRENPVQETLIQNTGLAPSNDFESAIHATLTPGGYTAVVRGNNNSAGFAVIEVYDLTPAVPAKLANISTRAFVSTGDDIVIAGFILGNSSNSDRIVVRGIGPSLTAFGVPDALANPTLELRNSNGTLLLANNNWQDDQAQAAELTAAGLAPSNPLESGIAMTLAPGAYTALLAGLNNGTGNGVVEVYDRGP